MAKNKVARPRAVPREFIVVVGGPSNTFNGYTEFDPVKQEDKPRPKPGTLDDLKNYLPPKPNPNFVGTHDLYWGNFVDPVHRLFKLGIAKPLPGDMVTVAVFFKPYEKRNDIDWVASPHNAVMWHKSPWVQQRTPYDSSVRKDEQGVDKPPSKPTGKKKNPNFGKEPVSDARIDHEILMRTTDESKGPQIKRPRRPNHYADLIHDIPRRCVHGQLMLQSSDVVMPSVLVKLLLVRDLAELLGYLATGNWSGERAIHILDVGGTEEDLADVGINEETTFDFYARGKVPPQALKFWKKVPVVDRKHVKIQRLDYFGHSNNEFWFLQYGLTNDKGKLPEGEVLVSAKTLIDQTFAFGPKPHFAKDSEAFFWGCSLGEPGGMAEKLVQLVPAVTACNDLTSYEGIADSDDSMPVPVPGGKFITFLKPQ